MAGLALQQAAVSLRGVMPPRVGGILRRPARAKVALRRPAAREEGRLDPPREKRLGDLGVAELSHLGYIWLKKAVYYQREVDLVCKVLSVRVQESHIKVEVEVSGTQDEALLRLLSGRDDRTAVIHACGEDCPALTSDETFLHGRGFQEVD